MAQDSFVQVAPDSSGKQIDMEQVATGAGQTLQRQRAAIVGDVADALLQMVTIQQQQLAVLRALFELFSSASNDPVTEEDFSQLP